MFLQLLQLKKAMYCLKNCKKKIVMIGLAKIKVDRRVFLRIKNLSIIVSSMYLGEKNKFLQLGKKRTPGQEGSWVSEVFVTLSSAQVSWLHDTGSA